MIKVLHVVESFGGGVQSYFEGIFNEAQGCTKICHLLAYSLRAETNKDSLNSINNEVVKYQLPSLYDNASPISRLRWIYRVFMLIKKEKVQVVHLHSSIAGGFGRLLSVAFNKTKFVYTPHGYSFLRQDIQKWKQNIFFSIEYILTKITQVHIVACSKTEGDYSSKLGLNKNRCIVINNAIELKKLEKFNKPDISLNQIINVGIVGRVTFARNPKLFAELAERFKKEASYQYNFHWIGGGDNQSEELLLSAGVKITGWLDRPDAIKALSCLDIYIQPSLWEGMPYSVIEAQALGIPVLASNIIGNKDIVLDGVTGFLCEDICDYISGLIQLQDPKIRMQIGAEAKDHIKNNFNVKNQYIALAKTYISLGDM